MVLRKPALWSLLGVAFFTCTSFPATQAWIPPPEAFLTKTSSSPSSYSTKSSSLSTRLYDKGPFGFLSPYESKIPEELRDEIYTAEANTAAAKERGQRVALYTLFAFVGILCAFFNGFLSELRAPSPDGTPGVDLVEAGFGWVVDNFFFQFLFLNKIGGGICLLGGAGAGLLAEAELDTKRINAEKIYEEMVRRREAKLSKKQKKRQVTPSTAGSKKKGRRTGKQGKRLEALSEVVSVEDGQQPETPEAVSPDQEASDTVDDKKDSKKEGDGGIFGKMKDLYDKADTMAASQALLMNKKLEDAGVIEKITDESGLKVIGREEAAKQQEKKKQEQKD